MLGDILAPAGARAASLAHAVALVRPAVAAGKEKIVSPPR